MEFLSQGRILMLSAVDWMNTEKRAAGQFSPRQWRPLSMAKSRRKRVPKTLLKLPEILVQ